MRTSHSVDLTLDADRAFAYLSAVGNEIHWRESVVGSRYVGTDEPALGVPGETDVRMGSKGLTMRWRIDAYDAEARFVSWELDGDPWRGGGSYRVRPRPGGGCTVTGALQVRLRGVNRALEPVVGLAFRRGLRGDLRRLAQLLDPVA